MTFDAKSHMEESQPVSITPFKVQFRVLKIQIEQKRNHFETVFFVKTF